MYALHVKGSVTWALVEFTSKHGAGSSLWAFLGMPSPSPLQITLFRCDGHVERNAYLMFTIWWFGDKGQSMAAICQSSSSPPTSFLLLVYYY